MEKLLAWSLAHSGDEPVDSSEERRAPQLNPEILAQLLGGKDDAQLMVEAMQCVVNQSDTLENRETAFDNLEQLIENLDNANNLENLKLWPPLISQLSAPEPAMRYMAAWVCGTAVQNNVKSQESLHKHSGASKIVHLALTDPTKDVRSKAIYAISSYVRNYQDGLDEVIALLPEGLRTATPPSTETTTKMDAEDMDAIDALRARIKAEGDKLGDAKQ